MRHVRKVMLALAVASSASAQMRTDSMEIASVKFPGARVFPERLLATTVSTVPTQCAAIAPLCLLGFGVTRNYLDPRNLDLDAARVRVFYFLQGYREARVTPDTVRREERIEVQFRVEEGRPVIIAAIDVAAAEDSFPRTVARSLPLQPGRPLSMTLLEATRDSLVIRLTNRGYARADVLTNYEIPPDDKYTARVRYDVIPGPLSRFGAIEIVGAEKVDSSVVRRMLTFQPGDLFRTEALLESQRNLFDQAVFRHAEVHALEASTLNDTLVPVRVQVNEGALHTVRTGLGVNTAEYLNGEIRWSSRSFRGGARRLEWRATVANVLAAQLDTIPFFQPTDSVTEKLAGSLSADFTQPWFLGPLNTFGAGAFAERQSIPGVFLRTSGGGYVNLARRLGANTSASVGYRPEFTKLQTLGGNAIYCAGFTACGEEEIDALGGGNWLSPFAISLVRNVSNSIFAPTRGYAIRVDAEIAGRTTFSDFSYIRLFADLTDYHTIMPGLVWALRLQPGYAREFGGGPGSLGVHPQKRFFAGGPNSVRGFPQYRLGPKVLTEDPFTLLVPADSGAGCSAVQINDGTCDATQFAKDRPDEFDVRPVGGAVSLVGNAELRFPVLGDNLRGAAFLDVGQVWRTVRDVNLDEFAWTPGFGVRYFSPIGPIRVDVGYYGGSGETVSVVTSKLGRLSASGACETVEPLPQLPRSEYCDTGDVVFLDRDVFWQPRRSFLDRLQFHFSIGQAF